MSKANQQIKAVQLSKEDVIAAYIRHWNTTGIMRNQWLQVPSMIGPVTVTKKNSSAHSAQTHWRYS